LTQSKVEQKRSGKINPISRNNRKAQSFARQGFGFGSPLTKKVQSKDVEVQDVGTRGQYQDDDVR